MNFFITNGIQRFYYHCFWLNTDFSNSFFVSPPTSLQWIVADKHFHQHQNQTQCILIEINICLFQLLRFYKYLWAVFTSIKKHWLCPVRQQRENCLKKKDANKMTTEAVHPKCPPFLCQFSARTHILQTQNWLWESSLSLLSLWCILFQIKLGLFRENLNLRSIYDQKMDGPRRAPFGTVSYARFYHRDICQLFRPSALLRSSARTFILLSLVDTSSALTMNSTTTVP